MARNIRNIDFSKEWEFKTSKSGGKGGQHVNKTDTKVELRFNIPGSQLLNKTEKQRLLKKLCNKITKQGILIITAEDERSQSLNKEKVKKRFYNIISQALQTEKRRIPTFPSRSAKEKRLQDKKQQGDKKMRRQERKNLWKHF